MYCNFPKAAHERQIRLLISASWFSFPNLTVCIHWRFQFYDLPRKVVHVLESLFWFYLRSSWILLFEAWFSSYNISHSSLVFVAIRTISSTNLRSLRYQPSMLIPLFPNVCFWKRFQGQVWTIWETYYPLVLFVGILLVL